MLAGSKTYLLYHGSTKRSQLTRLLEMLGNIDARIESRQLLNDKEDSRRDRSKRYQYRKTYSSHAFVEKRSQHSASLSQIGLKQDATRLLKPVSAFMHFHVQKVKPGSFVLLYSDAQQRFACFDPQCFRTKKHRVFLARALAIFDFFFASKQELSAKSCFCRSFICCKSWRVFYGRKITGINDYCTHERNWRDSHMCHCCIRPQPSLHLISFAIALDESFSFPKCYPPLLKKLRVQTTFESVAKCVHC